MKWLDDSPNLDKMFISIKERNKKGDNSGYSLTFSKSFKDYIKHSEMKYIRFGYDSNGNNDFNIVLQLNNEEIGLPLYNEKDQIRLWFEIANYVNQYLAEGLKIPFDQDLQVVLKRNGVLEVDLHKVKVDSE